MMADSSGAALRIRPERDLVPRGIDRAVTLLAVGLLAVAIVPQVVAAAALPATLAMTSLALWVIITLIPAQAPRALLVALLAAVVIASAAAAISTPLAGIPGLFALIRLLAAPSVPVWVGTAVGVAGAGVVGVGAILGTVKFVEALVFLGAAGASAAVGVSRRQYKISAQMERDAASELVKAHQALAENAASEERQRIARNLHDVLAHSLGALVIQLDAVEGLLDAGSIAEARARASSARRLAADGLVEARSAVRVLSDKKKVDASVLAVQIEALARTERQLGATVTLDVLPVHGGMAPAAMDAMHSAAREALTNARKHAPNSAVRVVLDAPEGRVRLIVSSTRTVPGPLSETGGGHGLAGMQDRFAELEGAQLRVTSTEDAFTVAAEVPVT